MTATVTRRAMLRGAVFVVAGGVGGFFVARNSAAARGSGGSAGANGYGYSAPKTSAASTRRRLAAVASIPSGGGVVVGGEHVVVTRDTSGGVHAFSAVCTHQGCTVSSVQNGVISCPCHGSRFSAQTGAVVGGPATRPLPPVQVDVSGGVVYAR